MDAQDAFCIALVLDPRFKARLLEKELGAETAGNIVNILKDALHSDYPLSAENLFTSGESAVVGHSIEARVLQKVQPHTGNLSDIEHYFNSAVVVVNESVTTGLFDWWRMHRIEFPRMAAAARDYLAIPSSEVAVERLFNTGRDLLDLRRHSLSADTMRKLVLLRDMYGNEEGL